MHSWKDRKVKHSSCCTCTRYLPRATATIRCDKERNAIDADDPIIFSCNCSGSARSPYEVTIDFVNRSWCHEAGVGYTATYKLTGAGLGKSYCLRFTENMESTFCTVRRCISQIAIGARLFETCMNTRLLKKNGLGMERVCVCYPCN